MGPGFVLEAGSAHDVCEWDSGPVSAVLTRVMKMCVVSLGRGSTALGGVQVGNVQLEHILGELPKSKRPVPISLFKEKVNPLLDANLHVVLQVTEKSPRQMPMDETIPPPWDGPRTAHGMSHSIFVPSQP